MRIFAISAALLYAGRALRIMTTAKDYIKFVCKQLKTPLRLRTERCSASMRFTLPANRFLQCATTRFLLKTCQKQTLFLHSSDCGYPYDGAKEHYVLDVENEN